RAAEFHQLGLASVHPVSGEHGRGAWEALEALVEALPAAPAAEAVVAEEPGVVRVALVGRPNVGKSSLLNRLLGEERVVVSDVPGPPRDAVDVRIERADGTYVFVDTAGLRRPGRRDRVGERASALLALRAIERADVALVVADAGQGFTEQDVALVGLVRERGCAAGVLLNKWDLVAAGEGPALRRAVAERLRFAPDTPVLG